MPSIAQDLEVRVTAKGRAVFATRHYHAGELVEQAPVILGDSDWSDLPQWVDHYVYSWQDIGGKGARQALALAHGSLFNSSTHANMSFRAAATNDAIEYHAARDIAPGEELTINYSSEHGEPTCDDNSWFRERGIHYVDH